jgi:hypothetical protein
MLAGDRPQRLSEQFRIELLLNKEVLVLAKIFRTNSFAGASWPKWESWKEEDWTWMTIGSEDWLLIFPNQVKHVQIYIRDEVYNSEDQLLLQ